MKMAVTFYGLIAHDVIIFGGPKLGEPNGGKFSDYIDKERNVSPLRAQ